MEKKTLKEELQAIKDRAEVARLRLQATHQRTKALFEKHRRISNEFRLEHEKFLATMVITRELMGIRKKVLSHVILTAVGATKSTNINALLSISMAMTLQKLEANKPARFAY